MATNRRIGAEDSATRSALLDAALQLMIEDGYAAVTSRRVAARADLKPQLVHYYFRTMDDLFVALVRRGAEQNLERQAAALASPRPLHALWEFNNDAIGAKMAMELSALANHRKAIRTELGTYAEQFRRLQREGLATALEASAIDTDAVSPDVILFLMTAVPQVLVMEEALDVSSGHDDTRALIELLLDRYEPEPAPADGE